LSSVRLPTIALLLARTYPLLLCSAQDAQTADAAYSARERTHPVVRAEVMPLAV